MTRVATFAGIDRHPMDISEAAARWLIQQLRDLRFGSDAALEAAMTEYQTAWLGSVCRFGAGRGAARTHRSQKRY